MTTSPLLRDEEEEKRIAFDEKEDNRGKNVDI
jgi:hypothetical protein